jgi:YD repeat-containing protein
MARLPTYTSGQVSLDAGQAPRATNEGASALAAAEGGLARAAGQIGTQVTDLGERLAIRQEKNEDFEAAIAYEKKNTEWQTQIDRKRESELQPNGAGFTENVTKYVTEDAKKWVSSLPPRLQKIYGPRLEADAMKYGRSAAQLEYARAADYQKQETSTVLGKLQEDIDKNPDGGPELEARGLKAIEAITDPGAREAFKKTWLKQARITEGFAKFRDNPAALAQLFGVVTPEGVGNVVDRIIGVESAGDPNAKSSRSSATGLGQFIEKTWLEMISTYRPELAAGKSRAEILELRKDPKLAREMTTRKVEQSSERLRDAGLPVTDGTLYLSHFAGAAGARALLRADPKADGAAIIAAADGKSRETIVKANPFLANMTAADVIAWADKKMNAKTPPAGNSRYTDVIPYEDRIKAVEASVRLYREQQVAFRGDVNARAADAAAAYMTTGVFNAAPTRAEFVQAYGEQGGAQRHEQLEAVRRLGDDTRRVATMSPEEQGALLQSYRPGEGPGFREQMERFGTMQKAIEAVQKAREADPAQEAMRAGPVRQAYEAMNQAMAGGNPDAIKAAVKAYGHATLAEQERFGPDVSPRLLTQDYVSRVTGDIAKTGEGQNMARKIQGLAAQWGPLWPKAFEELSKDKGLPGPALVIGTMTRPDQQLAAETLAEAVNVGKTTLHKNVPDTDAKDLKARLETAFIPFARTLNMGTNRPGSERTLATFMESAELLGLAYLRQGDNASTAAARAFKDMLGRKYTFEGTYRIPTERNASAVKAGATSFVASLPEKMAASLDLPPNFPKNYNVGDVRANYARGVQNNAMWVTAPDESGLVLLDGVERRVVTAGGRAVTLTWDELEKLSRETSTAQGQREQEAASQNPLMPTELPMTFRDGNAGFGAMPGARQ